MVSATSLACSLFSPAGPTQEGQPFSHPHVEMVERGGPKADEHLAGTGDGVGSLLDAYDLRAAVLVDPGGAHGTILS